MKRRIAIAFLVVSLGLPCSYACGVERWAVKTLADKDRLRVNTIPFDITIAELNIFPAPSRADLMAASDYRFAPWELQVYRVRGYLVGFKLETDEDFHIVIADVDDPLKTMVVEMPSEHCMAGGGVVRASWEQRFGKAKPKFKRVPIHKTIIEVIGYGFFDVIHGQTGVAANGIELHPVVSWKEIN